MIKKVRIKKYLAVDEDTSGFLYDSLPIKDDNMYRPAEGSYQSAKDLMEHMRSQGINLKTDDGVKEVFLIYEYDDSKLLIDTILTAEEDKSLSERLDALEKEVEEQSRRIITFENNQRKY